LITEFNDYIRALWTSRDIADQMLNWYCSCLTWRTHELSPGSGKLIEKEKGVQLHLNLGMLSFICHLSVVSNISVIRSVSVKFSGTLDKHTEGYCSAKSMNFLIDLLLLPDCCCASFVSRSICSDSHSP
jgi:hypothetical protein